MVSYIGKQNFSIHSKPIRSTHNPEKVFCKRLFRVFELMEMDWEITDLHKNFCTPNRANSMNDRREKKTKKFHNPLPQTTLLHTIWKEIRLFHASSSTFRLQGLKRSPLCQNKNCCVVYFIVACILPRLKLISLSFNQNQRFDSLSFRSKKKNRSTISMDSRQKFEKSG